MDKPSIIPVLHLELQLSAEILAALAPASPARAAVIAATVADIEALLAALGVPGVAMLDLAPADSGATLTLLVDGVAQGYPPDLPLRIRSLVAGWPLAPDEPPFAWLAAAAEVVRDGADHAELAAYLRRCCVEILKLCPERLFGSDQAAAYRAELSPPPEGATSWPPDLATVQLVGQAVLHQRYALARAPLVGAALAAGITAGQHPLDIAEELLIALGPPALTITMHPDDLRRITTSPDARHDMFRVLERWIYEESGLRLPSPRLAMDGRLPPGAFTIGLNQIQGLPWVGLGDLWWLVEGERGAIRASGVAGERAIRPDTGGPAQLVPASEVYKLGDDGLSMYEELGYLALCARAELLRHGACLVDRGATEALLGAMGAFPDLLGAIRERVPIAQLTRVIRGLLREQIPVRNIRLLLNRLLEYDDVLVDDSRLIVFDGRLPSFRRRSLADPASVDGLVNFVRMGMSRSLLQRYAGGRGSLHIYLVDHAIEAALEDRLPAPDERRRIVAAVRAGYQPEEPAMRSAHALLVGVEARAPLAALLRDEFPGLAVLSYQELPPETEIVPVARITLA